LLLTADRATLGGRFFVDTATGQKPSHFVLPEPGGTAEEPNYCAPHLGNTVHSEESDLLVNAWYTGGVDVIDFDDPTARPRWHTGDDTSENWSGYW
jgi:hypothetical protein